jgi:hypothetical protein
MSKKGKVRAISLAPNQVSSILDESGIKISVLTLSSSIAITSNAPLKVIISKVAILEFFHRDQNKFKGYMM